MAQPGGVYYGPAPVQDWEIRRAQRRPEAERTPIPKVGDTVGYRHDSHGPVVPAEILSVVMDDRTDPNVWHVVTVGGQPVKAVDGSVAMRLGPDPWPLVTLRTAHGLITTREARVAGSAGWLPAGAT